MGLGDLVNKGDTLAEVESSSSLQSYSVRAPISGTILERRTNAGDVAASEPLFVIGDLGAAQAELHVFPKDAGRIKPGQTATVQLAGGDLFAEGKIDSFLPMAEAGTQAVQRRLEPGAAPGLRIGEQVHLVKSAARGSRIVYASNHRSHTDYLVEPLVLALSDRIQQLERVANA